MEIILNFFVDNYLWFLIISLILIFGLIGYIVDAHEKRAPKLHFGNSEDINNEEIEEDKTLKELLEENSESDNSQLSEVYDVEENNSENNSSLSVNQEEENELPKM